MNFLRTSILWVLLSIYAIDSVYGQKLAAAPKCITPDRKIGTCINLRECSSLLQLLMYRGREPAVVNFLRNSTCGSIGNNPMLCCPSAATTNSVSPNNEELLSAKICGVPDISDKILGGEPSLLGDYPWMAALGYKRQGYYGVEWMCGGSLINTKYVLTAAHCLIGTQPWEIYKVRLGDLDLKDSVKDGATPIDFFIERTIVHEKHRIAPLVNDIALIKLRSSVQFTNLIKPICLPTTNDLRRINLEDEDAYVAGWGKTSYNFSTSNSYSSHLMDLKLPILNTSVCKKAYKKIPNANVDERNICAGFIQGHKDSCQGDSGGPLMWINPTESRYYLVGIVSFGYKCAEPGYPGVYTKVSEFVDWLKINAI